MKLIFQLLTFFLFFNVCDAQTTVIDVDKNGVVVDTILVEDDQGKIFHLSKVIDKEDTIPSKYAISINPSVVFGRELFRLPIFVPRLLKPGFGISIAFERKLNSAIALRTLASVNRAFYLGDRGPDFEARYDYFGFGLGIGLKIIEFKKHYFTINVDVLPSSILKHYQRFYGEKENLGHNGKFGLIGKLQAQYLYKLSKNHEIGATSSASYSIIQFPGPPPLYNGHIASYFGFGLVFKRNF